MSLWSCWNNDDKEESYIITWPMIVGNIRKEEIALVLEVSFSELGEIGVKIYTQRNFIGWICASQIKKVKL